MNMRYDMSLLYIWIIPTSDRCIVNLYTVTSYTSVRLNIVCTSQIIHHFWRHKWCVHEFNILLRLYKYLKLVFWVTNRIIPKIWTCYFFAFLARDKYLDKKSIIKDFYYQTESKLDWNINPCVKSNNTTKHTSTTDITLAKLIWASYTANAWV